MLVLLAVLSLLASAVAEPGTIQFTSSSFSFDESVGIAVVTLTRTGGADGAVTVDYITIDGTAISGSDYIPEVGTIQFLDGETEKSLEITIINDDAVDPGETFQVNVANPTGGAQVGTLDTVSLTIIDDDYHGGWSDWTDWDTCSLSCGGGTQSHSRECNNPSPSVAGNLCTLLDGTTGFSETQTQPCNTQSCLEPGTIQFTSSSFSVDESVGTAVLTLTRTGGADGAVTVDYATIDVTANAGSDFVAGAGTIQFLDGQTDKTLEIAILDDDAVDPGELFSVSLANPTGGAQIGTHNSAVVMILDNDNHGGWGDWSGWGTCSLSCGGGTQSQSRQCDNPVPSSGGNPCTLLDGTTGFSETQTQPCNTQSCPEPGTIQFTSSTFSFDESVGTAVVTLTRTGGADGAVTVDYATIDVTANAGSDFVAGAGTIQFPDGQTDKTLEITILDDDAVDPGELFQVSLANPTGGAQIGTNSMAMVEILDNDNHGGWSDWSGWDTCSLSCGGGTQSQSRQCDNPVPSLGGNHCTLLDGTTGLTETRTQPCNTQSCVVDGGWSEWVEGECTETCGEGTKLSTRTCDNPAPSNGGADCQGVDIFVETCSQDPCPDGQPESGWEERRNTAVCAHYVSALDAGQQLVGVNSQLPTSRDHSETLDDCNVECGNSGMTCRMSLKLYHNYARRWSRDEEQVHPFQGCRTKYANVCCCVEDKP